VIFQPLGKFIVEEAAEFPRLGKFFALTSGDIAFGGVVKEVTRRKEVIQELKVKKGNKGNN
jgi:hypothetical protein